MVEHRDLLGDADWIVPRQHDHHRTEFHMLGPARHVREKLEDIGHHRVVVEMMLDRPHRVEAERLRHLGKPHLVAIHLEIVKGIVRVLNSYAVTYVHGILLSGYAPLDWR